MSTRVLLTCKHKVISEGIAAVLRTHADIQLVGIADDDLQTISLCEREQPQVVVVGVDPRRAGDVALTRQVSQLVPRPEIRTTQRVLRMAGISSWNLPHVLSARQ